MSSFRLVNELSAVFVPIGAVGAVLAALCAIVAGAAIIRGAGGLSGGAVGVWIPFALLSSTASFANQWAPVVVAVAALVTMLVLGGVIRGIVIAAGRGASVMARGTGAAPLSVGTP